VRGTRFILGNSLCLGSCEQYLTATIAAKSHVVSLEDAQQMLSTFERILSGFAQDLPLRTTSKARGYSCWASESSVRQRPFVDDSWVSSSPLPQRAMWYRWRTLSRCYLRLNEYFLGLRKTPTNIACHCAQLQRPEGTHAGPLSRVYAKDLLWTIRGPPLPQRAMWYRWRTLSRCYLRLNEYFLGLRKTPALCLGSCANPESIRSNVDNIC
jgi:hypothetical protein